MAARFERGSSALRLVAETSPEFVLTFFACQYAGLAPAPIPMPVNLGGKEGYIRQVRQMIRRRERCGCCRPERNSPSF